MLGRLLGRGAFAAQSRWGLQVGSLLVASSLLGCSAERERVVEGEAVGEATQALASTPFFSPVTIPDGFLFASNYDNGGEGVAYHDTDAVNQGVSKGVTFRTNEGVDLEGTLDFPSGGDHVAWTAPGEWMNYTVDVRNSGSYAITAEVAAPAAGGAFHLVSGGVTVASFSVPATGGWQTFKTVTVPNVRLNAGVQTLQLVEDTGGFNLRLLTFATSRAFGGSPALVPGNVLAHNYDDGGEGIAYHDADVPNQGAAKGCAFRANERVDVECAAGNNQAPKNVGWTAAGEWLNYTVNVLKSGTYSITAQVAAPATGGTFRLLSGGTQLASLAVPSTGGWATFQGVTLPDVQLKQGIQTLQIAVDAAGFNLASLLIAPKNSLVKNGNFAQSLTSWTTFIDSRVSPGASIVAQSGKAKATITAGSNYQDWFVQLYQGSLPLLQGQAYGLAFDVSGCSGSTGGRFNVMVEHDGAPFTKYLAPQTVTIPDCQTTKHVAFDFTMGPVSDSQARVAFNLGLDNAAATNTLSFSNVVLTQKAFESPLIVGHIGNAAKVGLPGINVSLTGAQSASTVTDANGNFRFQVPAGNYNISAATPAGSTLSPASINLSNLVGDTTADFSCTGTCAAAPGIVSGKELVITDPSVLGDARASSAGATAGVWSFRAMMEQLAPVGVDPADFVEAWLSTFADQNLVINGFSVPSRDTTSLRALWPKTGNGKLDLSRAPFQLLAIVNRVDVGAQGNGEGRFVYGLSSGGLGMTVIFEYGLPSQDATNGATLTRGNWASKWHALGALSFGAGFNSALESVTSLFTKRGTSPSRPGQSSINQVRSSENLMNPGLWQWRQFHLQASGNSVVLKPAQTSATPVDNAGFQGSAESLVMIEHLNANPVLLHGGYIDVPSGVIGGASNISRFSWNFPGAVVMENARHNFAGMTCNGCHTLEAQNLNLDVFYQISPLSAPGADGTGRLSPFIKQVDIPRRQMFMQNRLTCSGATCAAGAELMVQQ